MTAARIVEPELLDSLPPDDPRAIRSRRDLQRVNRLMASTRLLGNLLDPLLSTPGASTQLVELGAGDGALLLRLARRMHRRWPKPRLVLVDLQPVVEAETIAGFRALGWTVDVVRADVFDWLARTEPPAYDRPVVLANLFLHHFDAAQLPSLLSAIAARTRAFACLEPRRSALALLGSRLLGAIGCNDVTRHDAVVSVRAGFSADELSRQWPRGQRWTLQEGRAGLFSHRFLAVRDPE